MFSVFSVNASAPCPRTLVQVRKKLDGVKSEVRKRERNAQAYVALNSGRGDGPVTGHDQLDEAVNITYICAFCLGLMIQMLLPFLYSPIFYSYKRDIKSHCFRYCS